MLPRPIPKSLDAGQQAGRAPRLRWRQPPCRRWHAHQSHPRAAEGRLVNSIAKNIEISASGKDLEDAVQSGLRRVATTVDKVQGAWVSDIKVRTSANGEIVEWRVCLRVTFIVD
ncbi:MAG: dodecin domain-containing protein [Xanthomonadaceae bacterium]|nr:dodecin domain-containing protein [Xanthomonadaceae bacterium]MDE2317734.1 dodecin domain-containing protein [Xanthomonadaceae bacterium]